MRTGYIYLAVIFLQFVVLGNNIFLIRFQGNLSVFHLSIVAYLLSIILVVIGVLRGAKAGSGNCFMTLLFLINLFFLISYLFSGYLNSFIHGVK